MTDVSLNASEVFEIAEQIERDGQAFYRLAAERTELAEGKTLFRELADWESVHEQTFKALHAKCMRDPQEMIKLDPDGEEAKYLDALAHGKIFDLRRGPDDLVDACGGDLLLMLRAAIARENEAVVFYTALQAGAVSEEDRQRIEAIVQEEMSHVRILCALRESREAASGGAS